MNRPLLFAAVCAALPGCAVRDAGTEPPAGTEPYAMHCPMSDNKDRAASALPARASTRPEPQLGAVAPNTRVPSHAATPSMRAMERNMGPAAQAGPGAHVDKMAHGHCPMAGAAKAPKQGS